MSEVITNLSDLKDKIDLEKPADEQPAPETNTAPEQGKKTLKDRFAEAKKASVTKKIEKEQAKIAKLQTKLNPVEKKKIDKKKLIVGASIGAAILGSIGAAALRCANNLEGENPCDETESSDCCEQPIETEAPEENQENEA